KIRKREHAGAALTTAEPMRAMSVSRGADLISPASSAAYRRDLLSVNAGAWFEGTLMNQSVVATNNKRVFVVDDHPIVRKGLTLLINGESDLTVCGDAEDAQTAMRSITLTNPDVLMLDLSLNGPDGLDLLKSLRASYPDLPVLILSMHDESLYA